MKYIPIVMIALFLTASRASAQQPKEADFKLQSTLLDKYPKEHLLALRVDTMNRMFVGAYESLFVYEPKKDGGYEARKLIYRFPPDVWIHDIETRGDHLYVLTDNALYLFVDGVRKREGLLPKKLIWGAPLGTKNHGCSTLAWGPEGDLYFALGGPGPYGKQQYWTFFTEPEGTRVPYRGIGGVFRCKPDGSGLRLVAEGLREPRGMTFDREWNLFVCDNFGNRFLHVTPHARMTELVSMGDDHGVPGPWYVDEPALPAALRHRVMIFNRGKYWCHSMTPDGATFKSVDPITMPAGPGAVSIGCGGEMFVLVSQSDIYKLTNADDPKAHAFEPYEPTEASDARLWQELGSTSWQRRSRAHLEITRRGDAMLKEANKRLLTTKVNDPEMLHLIWLAARSGRGSLHLLSLVNHAHPRIRAQAIRALTEFPGQLNEEPLFTKALLDNDLHVRHAALLAYFEPKIAFDRAIQQAVERGPAIAADPRLKQSAALLLAQKSTLKQLETLCGSSDPAMRIAGVRAAGYRLTLVPLGTPLARQLTLGEVRSRMVYADGVVELKDRGPVGMFTIASHWKADMHTEEQNLLFKLLVKLLDDEEATVREQAALVLSPLEDERSNARVRKILKQ